MEGTMPQEWGALCLLVAALGARHGLDPDHLAAIDGLARCNARVAPRLAARCGALFSAGHGSVVIAIALVASTVASHWRVPPWMDAFGAWSSICVLLGLGALNLRAVLLAPTHELVAPVGLRARFLGRLARASSPAGIALVGALFALSFDTISQALLFTVAATRFGGWQQALFLGAIFTGGMFVTDGMNGLWIARLLRRADRMALVASRTMGLAVALLGLFIATLGILRQLSPGFNLWSEGRETGLGVTVIAIVAGSFLLARALAAPGTPAGAPVAASKQGSAPSFR
jgi:nickel/cobalt transporter (NiCoT) family protein